MSKRILAWVLLIGFIIFIVNFCFIGYYRPQSIVVYLAIVAVYLAVNSRKKEKKS